MLAATMGDRCRFTLVVAVLGASACASSSVIIKRDDTEFVRAMSRLESTKTLVETAASENSEGTLFMMAEGLYRYRLRFPERNLRVYAAQAAAVAIELPALQAVAGSLDLFQLRLKTTEGAVQIWETLLDWYPQSRLRPLALYRLGWAYRNTSAGGFPRESGDEALDLLARENAGTPWAKLASDARQTPWKSTEAATAWSIVPGLGQIYVGEYGSGMVRIGVALASVAMLVTPAVLAYRRRSDLTWSRDWPLLARALTGLIVLSVDYTLAYEDAIRGVVEFNERQERAFELRHPHAP
jgi:hypothetical protein